MASVKMWREARVSVPPAWQVDRPDYEPCAVLHEIESGIWFIFDQDSGMELAGPFSVEADARWVLGAWETR
jgi:hypothetical protein